MDKFFGKVIGAIALFFWLGAASLYFGEEEIVGAIVLSTIAFALSFWSSRVLARVKHLPKNYHWIELDTGLKARVVGHREIEIQASEEWYETRNDFRPYKSDAKRLSKSMLNEFREYNVRTEGVRSNDDGGAVLQAIDEIEFPCWNCGEDVHLDSEKCLTCWKMRNKKPIKVRLVRIADTTNAKAS